MIILTAAEEKRNTGNTSDLPAHSHNEVGHRVTRTTLTKLDLIMQVIKEATMAHDLVDRRLRRTNPPSSVLELWLKIESLNQGYHYKEIPVDKGRE